tara:strand:+ start:61 stop:984 length:924 start_codon:yes stop_codon:yes gene_type:complete
VDSIEHVETQKNKEPRELFNLDVREVSLVDTPAIRRRFLVVKRDEGSETMSADQEFVSEEIETETEALMQKNSDDIEKGYHEMKDEDDSLKEESAKGAHEEDEEEEKMLDEKSKGKKPSKKKKVKKESEEMDQRIQASSPVSFSKRDDGSYDLTGVPEEMQATVEQLCKAQDAAIEKAAELEEILKAERDERLRRDFVEKAEKEFSNIPGTAVEVGLLLKSLHDLDGGVAEKVEGIFKSVNARLSTGAIFDEVGAQVVEDSASAWNKIEKQAEELITNGVEVSKASAIARVLDVNPSLYSEYLKEGK